MTLLCAVGDVHGHLQLALVMAARWQMELDEKLDAVLLAGDVGVFRDPESVDRATRRHAEANPCELEVALQWMNPTAAPWLEGIFASVEAGGLGLSCPIIMVAGNHEDFDHLRDIAPTHVPPELVTTEKLPPVDPLGRIRYLPSGWRCTVGDGVVIAGVGGIDRAQRGGYRNEAYIDEAAIQTIEHGGALDVLLTHTGPSVTQPFPAGSPLLDRLATHPPARVWFHGHAIANDTIRSIAGSSIVPLHGIPFEPRSDRPSDPGRDAWCVARLDPESVRLERLGPAPGSHTFWHELKRTAWIPIGNIEAGIPSELQSQLLAPHLAGWRDLGRKAPRRSN